MKKQVIRKTCVKCGHEFTYKERFQSMYRFWWRMNCGVCGMRYNVLMRYRLLFGVLLFATYMLWTTYFLNMIANSNLVWPAFGLMLAWIAIITFVMPRFTSMKLDPEKEEITENQSNQQNVELEQTELNSNKTSR